MICVLLLFEINIVYNLLSELWYWDSLMVSGWTPTYVYGVIMLLTTEEAGNESGIAIDMNCLFSKTYDLGYILLSFYLLY
jgi:hypothetical protein